MTLSRHRPPLRLKTGANPNMPGFSTDRQRHDGLVSIRVRDGLVVPDHRA
ncbi:hypothetical protein [Sphingomonas zeae]